MSQQSFWLGVLVIVSSVWASSSASAAMSGYQRHDFEPVENTPAEVRLKRQALDRLRKQWDGDDYSDQDLKAILSRYGVKGPDQVIDNFNSKGVWYQKLPRGKSLSEQEYDLHKQYFAELIALAQLARERGGAYKKTLYSSLAWYFGNNLAAPPRYHETFSYHAPGGTVGGLLVIAGLVIAEDIHRDRKRDKDVERVFQAMRKYGRQFINASPQIRGPNWSFRLDNGLRYVLFTNEPVDMDEYEYHWKNALSFNRWEQETDGVHPDWSMMHHGDMNYWGMYGIGWTARILEYGELFDGTPWEYDTPELDFIADCMIEGVRWVLYRGNCEYTSAPKRGTFLLARTDNVAASFKELVIDLLKLGGNRITRRDELIQLGKDIILPPWSADSGQSSRRPELTGHRYFWTTEYQVHRRPDFAIYTRRSSQRTRPPEDSSQKAGSLHLNYGTGYTPIMRRGDELRFSRLAWDFEKVPGTTVEQGQTVSAGKAGSTKRGLNLFSGGVSDGLYGCGAFEMRMVEFDRDNSGKFKPINGAGGLKANFYFDDGMIAVGQNIRRVAEGKGKILTTLNNVIRIGETVYAVDGSDPEVVKPGRSLNESIEVESSAWVWHDRVGYVVVGAADLVLSLGPQSFHDRLKQDKDFRSAITKELGGAAWSKGSFDMFRLWIDHGVNPRRDTYVYAVLPNCSVDEMPALVDQVAEAVRQNEDGVMAVAKDGVSYAVFAKGGTAQFAKGQSLRSRVPLLVMARPEADDPELTFHAANPEHRGLRREYVPGRGKTVGKSHSKPVVVQALGFGDASSLSFDLPTERGEEGASVQSQ